MMLRSATEGGGGGGGVLSHHGQPHDFYILDKQKRIHVSLEFTETIAEQRQTV